MIMQAEQYSDVLVTWNPSDHDINKEVMTPFEVMEKFSKNLSAPAGN